MAAEAPEPMTRGMRLVARGMGVLFLATGVTKLLGLSSVEGYFEHIGLPVWMVWIAGGVEIGLGGLMFFRRTWQYAAMGILAWMVMAALSHVMSGVGLYLLFFNASLINLCLWLLEKDPPPLLNVRLRKRASLGRE